MDENACKENARDMLWRISRNYKPRRENAEDRLPRTARSYNPCRENGKGRLLRTTQPTEQRDKRTTKQMQQGNCEVATGMNFYNL
jgi:hypothetical protein